MTPWEIDAVELANCNCAYGCPCQFNSLPTKGSCEAAVGILIHKGHHGDVRLDGLRAAFVAKWPGPIHMGNGTIQSVIDSSATAAQRKALETILSGGDTEDMATAFWVFSKMAPNRLETLYRPIEISIDLDRRRGHVRVQDVFEIDAEPIRNPVTGAEHRARIDLPHGFEFRIAEMASGTTRTMGTIQLTDNNGTHAHMARLNMNGRGVIDQAA
jgi:hypothetical protein